jgi:hypothetical protein
MQTANIRFIKGAHAPGQLAAWQALWQRLLASAPVPTNDDAPGGQPGASHSIVGAVTSAKDMERTYDTTFSVQK